MRFILAQQLAAGLLTLNLVIGYGVAPVLFSHLESQVAGAIMAVLLKATYWVDLVVLLVMFVLVRKGSAMRRDAWLGVAMISVGVNLTWVSPLMVALKQSAAEQLTVLQMGFAAWHGVSQLLFLVTWLSVLIWVVLSLRSRNALLSPFHK